MTQFQTNAIVALGANLTSTVGAPADTLINSVLAIGALGHRLRAISRFFRTPCFPAGTGPDYVNAVVLLATLQSAGELLSQLHQIESEFGRERVQRWGKRTLDLDLIAFGDAVVPDSRIHAHWRNLAHEDQIRTTPDQLILPHPRLQDRSFVLVPMADLLPGWVHPLTGQSVTQMLSVRPRSEIEEIRPL